MLDPESGQQPCNVCLTNIKLKLSQQSNFRQLYPQGRKQKWIESYKKEKWKNIFFYKHYDNLGTDWLLTSADF